MLKKKLQVILGLGIVFKKIYEDIFHETNFVDFHASKLKAHYLASK